MWMRAPLRGSAPFLVLMAIWLFFYFATDGTFLTQRNLVLLALQSAIISLAAISAVMLIVSRNFDLPVGSAVALGDIGNPRNHQPDCLRVRLRISFANQRRCDRWTQA